MDDQLDALHAQFAAARFRPGVNPHIAARIIGEPLMVAPLKLGAILGAIGARIGIEGFPVAAAVPASSTLVRTDRSSDYDVVDGIAVVQVFGTIVKRNGGNMLNSSGMFALEAARETIATAKTDSNVKGVLLQLDTNGGEAVGTPEFARWLFSQRGDGTPVWAAIDDAAYSAGAYIAAAADRTLVTPSGGGGSIGVIALHVDASDAYAAEGYKITPIFAGARKIDGASFAPLSIEAYQRFQTRVDAVWEAFTEDVGLFRNLPASQVRSYQALTFHGADLVDAGLADGVATFDEVLAAFKDATALRASGGPARKQGGQRMDKEKEQPGATAGAPDHTVSMDRYRADTKSAEIEGRRAERARCARINALATMAKMPVADAKKLAAQLIADDATIEVAQDAFVVATEQAEKIAASTELTGERGSSAAALAGIKVPVLRATEDVISNRFSTPRIKRRQLAVAAVEQLLSSHNMLDTVADEGGL